jgi:hypothetical protein
MSLLTYYLLLLWNSDKQFIFKYVYNDEHLNMNMRIKHFSLGIIHACYMP